MPVGVKKISFFDTGVINMQNNAFEDLDWHIHLLGVKENNSASSLDAILSFPDQQESRKGSFNT